jgi:hypothetical protein
MPRSCGRPRRPSRQRLIALAGRWDHRDDAAFQRIEQELDWEELDLQQLIADDDSEP